MNKKIVAGFKVVVAGALLQSLWACSSLKVQTAADPKSDLSQYKTYSWVAGPPGPPPSILDQTIKPTLERELAKKGLKPVAEKAKPDMVIRYFGVSKDQLPFGVTPSYDVIRYPYYAHYDESVLTREGNLTVQFIDPKTNRIIWQGTVMGDIGAAGMTQEQIAKAVDKLIENYPAT